MNTANCKNLGEGEDIMKKERAKEKKGM